MYNITGFAPSYMSATEKFDLLHVVSFSFDIMVAGITPNKIDIHYCLDFQPDEWKLEKTLTLLVFITS